MKKLNKKGFTLMELIIVIAIIAVLMLILVPTMGGFVGQAKTEALRANAKAAYTGAIAQQTAADAGLNDGAYDFKNITSNKLDCSKLDSDFYEADGSDTCVVNFVGGRVDSVTYGSGSETATYPEAESNDEE